VDLIPTVSESTESGSRREAASVQTQLDGLVVTVELTLISIIQGLALSFLAVQAQAVVVDGRLAYWPYLATGLMTILLFWSRSLVHTLTVIRWPLEFVHNFMYVACTLVQTVMFSQLTNPVGWNRLATVFSLMVWGLYAFDLRMIRRRIHDSPGPTADRLYALVEREQIRNVRWIMPGIILFSLGAVVALETWPEVLIDRRWHVAIAVAQMLGSVGYLAYTVRLFALVTPLIVRTRGEWRDDVLS